MNRLPFLFSVEIFRSSILLLNFLHYSSWRAMSVAKITLTNL